MTQTVKERLTSVEVGLADMVADVSEMKSDLKAIMTNHLPHIERKIDQNGWRIALITGGIIFALQIGIQVLLGKLL